MSEMLPWIARWVVPAAYSVLPDEMADPRATAMILAIALQESGLRHRYQVPTAHARGFWQFERAGVLGVLTHHATAGHAGTVLHRCCYQRDDVDHVHEAIAHNDVLACALARLLVWTLPEALPRAWDPDEGWRQYLEAWRPGRPHPETWPAHFREAWRLIG